MSVATTGPETGGGGADVSPIVHLLSDDRLAEIEMETLDAVARLTDAYRTLRDQFQAAMRAVSESGDLELKLKVSHAVVGRR